MLCSVLLLALASFAELTAPKFTLKEMMQMTQEKEPFHWQRVVVENKTVSDLCLLPAVSEVSNQKPLSKAAAMDTTEVYFTSFWADPIYYEAGDWYFVLKNERYQFIFDIYGAPATDCSGTYTEKDLDIEFSWAGIPAANGKTSYYKSCDLKIQAVKQSDNLTLYVLEATVVTTLGIGGEVNGAFKIYAEHQMITPSVVVEEAISGASITPYEDYFVLAGKDDSLGLEVDMTFFFLSEYGIEGMYTDKQIDLENSKIVYNEKEYEIMNLEAGVVVGELKSGQPAYVIMMEALTTDTTFFNIAMAAPIIPTDTVSFSCINLVLDDSYGVSDATIYITASNKEYSLYGAYNATSITAPASYVGGSSSGNAMMFITEIATDKVISPYKTKLYVNKNRKGEYSVDMEVLGSDHVFYTARLIWYVPTPVDTVPLYFENNSKSMYYITELGLTEVQLANYNEDYSVSFDFLKIETLIDSDFKMANLWMEQSFITKHNGEEDYYVEFADVKGALSQKNDTTFVTAEVIGLDSILYDVKMFYTVPTPTDTVTAFFGKKNSQFTNALPQGIFILEGMTDDESLKATIQVSRIENEKLVDTFINDGRFGECDFDNVNTYVSVYNAETEEYEQFAIQQGTLTVTLDENKDIVAVASFICEDAKLYNLTFNTEYKRVHLQYDSDGGEIDYTYSSDSYITFYDDYVDTDGLLYVEILAADSSNVSEFAFFIDELDPVITIPEGVYPINNSMASGTVFASRGIGTMDGLPIPSYFCELNTENGELYYNEYGLYCMVDGTVTVENVNGILKVDVDAVNSYEVPVKLHFQVYTDVEDVLATDAIEVKKLFVNGQLYIVRGRNVYAVTGTQLK